MRSIQARRLRMRVAERLVVVEDHVEELGVGGVAVSAYLRNG